MQCMQSGLSICQCRVTTLINVVLDGDKMEAVRQMRHAYGTATLCGSRMSGFDGCACPGPSTSCNGH